ncbi:MAG: porphobilinogen synthase [Candidatus Omnitrophica bacterium]|nr:porphobilinogen synthase [Candidatus Omnitrophota bacterium]
MMPPQTSYRPGRLRQRAATRALIRETSLRVEQLVMPLFVRAGKGVRAPIPSMPGQFQFSVDQLVKECQELHALGVPAVLLFALAERKDERATRAYAKDGLMQQAVHAIKSAVPSLLVITDVCLCAYTSHGHCGVLKSAPGSRLQAPGRKKSRSPVSGLRSPVSSDVMIDREATLELLAKTACSHAQAGADLVAPSDMTDGNVGAVRQALDRADFEQVPILAYSVKYASAFYGPFREAVDSAPQFGDRRSYQMDVANSDEALREARLDIEQGADIVMVKPALAYLDVIRRLKQELGYPVAAFNVSGEYAMVKAAAARGWIAERSAWQEMLTAMTRSGADILMTYWAKDAALFLRQR